MRSIGRTLESSVGWQTFCLLALCLLVGQLLSTASGFGESRTPQGSERTAMAGEWRSTRGLIQETVKATLGRRPVHESYQYDARLRLTGFEAQEQSNSTGTTITPYPHSRHARAGYAGASPERSRGDDWNRLTALQHFGYTNSAAPVDELFDNLQHRYASTALNAPTQVYDYARHVRGHSNTSTSSTPVTRYTYNAAGDVVYDQDKGLTYAYNALGLVARVTRSDGSELTYRYAADETLVASTESQPNAGSGTTLLAQVYYRGGDRYDAISGEAYVQTPFGASLLDGGLSAKHVSYHADHLGNIMLAYADLNGDGFVDPRTEILEESRYYPYGLKQAVYNRQSVSLPFAYNGAESQDGFGLHLTTYRTMAPEVAIWGQVDPKAGLNYAYSPYSSMNGNPITHTDPNGDVLPAIAIGAIIGAVSGGIAGYLKDGWNGAWKGALIGAA